MAVPTLITDLNTVIASNVPAGGEAVFPNLDDYLRALSAFIAQLNANKLALTGGTLTGPLNAATGLNVTGSGGFFNAVNKFGVDNLTGATRLYSSGPNAATRGSFELHGISSDGSSDVTQLTITTAGVIQDNAANELGYKGLPSASVNAAAFVAADRGKCVYAIAGVTIPNATMATGDVVTIINTTASAITITSAITALRQAGTLNTGNRTLASYGMARVVFVSPTLAFIGGDGVT